MSVTEVKQTKMNLIAWIEQLSDTNMLSFLEGLKNSKSNIDWWDSISETERNHINEGLNDMEAGRIISSVDFWNKLKNG